MEQLDRATTKKEIEGLARKFTEDSKTLFNDSFRWGYVNVNKANSKITRQNVSEAILLYRCLTKSISLYDGANGLPLFIHDKARELNKTLTQIMVEIPELYTYENYVSTYEFCKTVRMPSHRRQHVENLSKLIGPNPTLYTIKDTTTTPTHFKLSGIGFKSSLLYLEDIKYHLDHDITYTYLEELLTSYYAKLKDTDDNVVTSTSHLLELATIIENRVSNG